MIIFKKVAEIRNFLDKERLEGSEIGFIPTMGALHEGHISLVQQSLNNGNYTVCSIFVNPTQFNDKKDLELYPVTPERDIEMLLEAGCNVLFMPDVQEMYPNGFDRQPAYNFGNLEQILEGEKRPGHFKGVGQIVGRLLEIVLPDWVYLGQKDYQQCMVITRLTELMQIKDQVKIVICPTQREPDGLAMSSRNRRLSTEEREKAVVIFECLEHIRNRKLTGNFAAIKMECEQMLKDAGFETEYIALADSRNLNLLDNYNPDITMVSLIAARIGNVRLIDNILIA